MDEEEIRTFCRKLLETGMTPVKVKHQLTIDKFNPDLIDKIVEEYTAQWHGARARRRRLRQAAGLGLFLACGGPFIYYVCFASENTMIFIWPLLAGALWGLLWAFGPPLFQGGRD